MEAFSDLSGHYRHVAGLNADVIEATPEAQQRYGHVDDHGPQFRYASYAGRAR